MTVHFFLFSEQNLVSVCRKNLQLFSVGCLQFSDSFRENSTE